MTSMSKLWSESSHRAALVDSGRGSELLWRDAQYRTLTFEVPKPCPPAPPRIADYRPAAPTAACMSVNPTGVTGVTCDLFADHEGFHRSVRSKGQPAVLWMD